VLVGIGVTVGASSTSSVNEKFKAVASYGLGGYADGGYADGLSQDCLLLGFSLLNQYADTCDLCKQTVTTNKHILHRLAQAS
jgi:hypothetical protein